MGLPRRRRLLNCNEAQEVMSTPSETTYRSLFAKLFAGGAAVFTILLLALHAIQPDLSPTWRFISEYARGDMGWLMSLAFIAMAVTCIAAIPLFWKQLKGWVGRIGLVLLGISGVGMILAGLFVTDPINTPMDQLSDSGMLHSMGGQLNLTSFAILFLTIALVRQETWKKFKVLLWTITAVCLLADVAFIVTAASAEGSFGPDVYTGLFGRITILCFAVWVMVASTPLLRSRN